MLFEKCFHLLSFMLLFFCSVIMFFKAEFLCLSNMAFLWGFSLMIMVRSYHLRILAFDTNHLIFHISLQHLKASGFFCRLVSPFCVEVETARLLKILVLFFFKL